MPEEPIFILKARDRLAPGAIEVWIAMAEKAGVSVEKISDARDTLAPMNKWRSEHRGKIPD